ncbi:MULTISPECIES: hypothetical protein [Hymenobacter]|uniref:NlpE N-terminal domain-containing protein n=1 Tax=Hymenobacter mucosus TaxID=1411120 RepID=A0A238VLC0_9BACT|nr:MULTISPECIES: hypothetical protein [Hymenobacter]SNR34523.1 hypothetical protein SAMN06269173_101771 [Hymenobacter mucosus]
MVFRILVFGLLLSVPPAAMAQRKSTAVPKLAPSFFTTYSYLSYTILDKGTSPTPMPARGVGGTLALRPDGSYQKRLTLAGNGTTLRFDQDGRYTFAGDKISFSYADKNGQPRTDQGTFRLRNGVLTIEIQGYPAGNQSTYTLRQQ